MKKSCFLRIVTLSGGILMPILLLSFPLSATDFHASDTALPGYLTMTPGVAFAAEEVRFHGITIRLGREGRVVVATCSYEGGGPVSGGAVTVYRPGGADVYTTGTTDPGGIFAFLPGESGEWRLVVDDGMGHRKEARIETGAAPRKRDGPGPSVEASDDAGHDDDHGNTVAPSSPTGFPEHTHSEQVGGSERPWRLATGLSLIVGLTGLAYGITARRG